MYFRQSKAETKTLITKPATLSALDNNPVVAMNSESETRFLEKAPHNYSKSAIDGECHVHEKHCSK